MQQIPKVFKRAKILATVGPASNSYEQILDMLKSGVNGFRLNFSHGTYDEREQQLAWIRKASKEAGKPVAILEDLQGPKIRLGDFEGAVSVRAGEQWTLVYKQPYNQDKKEIPLQYDLSKKVKPGERLAIFDGKIKTQITGVSPGKVQIRIENDGMLFQRKGVNVPDTHFGGDVLTKKDIEDVEWGRACLFWPFPARFLGQLVHRLAAKNFCWRIGGIAAGPRAAPT